METVQAVNNELEQALIKKMGNDRSVPEAFARVRELLDEEGMKAYILLVESFLSVDSSFSHLLLSTGYETLSTIQGRPARCSSLEMLLEMGRSKWSVVEQAYRMLPHITGVPGEFIPRWLGWGKSLANIDQDVAIQYFDSSPTVIAGIGHERTEAWALSGLAIAKKTWKAAREYFRSSPEITKKMDFCDMDRWARLGLYLIEKSPQMKASYNVHSLLAQGSGAGKSKTMDLAVQYFRSAPQILGRLSLQDLENWVQKGLQVTDTGSRKGEAYFSLSTGTSRKEMDSLVKGLELKDIQAVLASYAQSLMGRKMRIRSSSVFYKNLPGLGRFFSVSDGSRVFIPSRMEVFGEEELNFKTYKWALTHELAHLLFGTFEITRDDTRQLDRFPATVPAFKIFEFLEDERVDHLMGLLYPGLEKDRQLIMQAFAEQGRRKDELGQSVFASVGFRLQAEPVAAALPHQRQADLLSEAVSQVTVPQRAVQDVLDTTLRLCEAWDSGGSCDAENRERLDRVFYRGVIDLKLVEETHLGMENLVNLLAERFREKNIGATSENIEKALDRIDEAEGTESEMLLWQITDPDGLAELSEQVERELEEIEKESRFRRTVFYDEWDNALEDYKKDWCRVREIDMPATSLLFYEGTVQQNYGMVSLLRRHFGLLRPDRIKRIFREERGDDLDLDALIESVVERHAGIAPSDRVYIRRDKKLRDVSVAFLVDMSYSTGEVLPSGKRIIDVEREGLVMMAEALESIGDRWAVYGFSSERKDKVDFHVIRDFDEPFNDEVKMRFEGIKPMAQTRLGAAIRHANRLLGRQNSLIRLLILLSDGRPYDIDYGDMYYAVEDTKMALWEGRTRGITSYCITVDKKSRDYLSHMYGEANYTIIDNIDALPISLPLIYKKLTV
jgi:nitric oxide reductase NorD protein